MEWPLLSPHRSGIEKRRSPGGPILVPGQRTPTDAALLGVPPQADESYYVGFEAAGQHIGLVPGGSQGMLLQDR